MKIGFDGYNASLTGAVSSTLGVNCGLTTGRNGVLEIKCFTEKRYFEYHEDDKSVTIRQKSGSYGGGGSEVLITDEIQYAVRRLTPLECERLQGFPDGWTDIPEFTDEKGKKRKTKDSHRYRALGNSIALPPWRWVLSRISEQYAGSEEKPTMASLFDGIGGFPLIWQEINGDGTCIWTSEIEPFCVSLTKERFVTDEKL